LRSLPNIIRVISQLKYVGHVARMSERRGTYGVLVGKPGENRPRGRRRCRWEDDT
jgi:hypothetical protein